MCRFAWNIRSFVWPKWALIFFLVAFFRFNDELRRCMKSFLTRVWMRFHIWCSWCFVCAIHEFVKYNQSFAKCLMHQIAHRFSRDQRVPLYWMLYVIQKKKKSKLKLFCSSWSPNCPLFKCCDIFWLEKARKAKKKCVTRRSVNDFPPKSPFIHNSIYIFTNVYLYF